MSSIGCGLVVCGSINVRTADGCFALHSRGREEHSAGDHQENCEMQLPRAQRRQPRCSGFHQEVRYMCTTRTKYVVIGLGLCTVV